MKLNNELTGKPYGITSAGYRVYKIKRGMYQLQSQANPGEYFYSGTKKRIENFAGRISLIK